MNRDLFTAAQAMPKFVFTPEIPISSSENADDRASMLELVRQVCAPHAKAIERTVNERLEK